jgi:hypothetical protein
LNQTCAQAVARGPVRHARSGNHLYKGPAWSGYNNAGKEEVFFFEKKNQKTFVTSHRVARARGAKQAKVFCFFFSKKKTFLT